MPFLSDGYPYERPRPVAVTLHEWFVFHSGLYRTFYAGAVIRLNTIDPGPQKEYRRHTGVVGERIGNNKLAAFAAEHPDMPMIVFRPTGPEFATEEMALRENVKYLQLDNTNYPEEFNDPHPPSHVYERYAWELAEFMLRGDYLKSILLDSSTGR